MDNQLNEVRKQITDLRAEMNTLENQIRLAVRSGLECGEASHRLLEARRQMVKLIRERNVLGGAEAGLTYNERFVAAMARTRKA